MTKTTVVAISDDVSRHIQQSTNSGSQRNGGSGDDNGRGNGNGNGNINGDNNKLKAAAKEMVVAMMATATAMAMAKATITAGGSSGDMMTAVDNKESITTESTDVAVLDDGHRRGRT